jgi:hypothetical protein
MSPVNHFADQPRCGIRDPSEDEKCRAGATVIEEVERALGACLQASLETVPPILMDDRLQGGDLKIVLERDREDVKSAVSGLGYPAVASGGTLDTGSAGSCD